MFSRWWVEILSPLASNRGEMSVDEFGDVRDVESLDIQNSLQKRVAENDRRVERVKHVFVGYVLAEVSENRDESTFSVLK